MKEKQAKISRPGVHGYNAVLADVVHLIETARSTAARTVNAVVTATYWAIGQRIVEHEQGGAHRAAYGEELLKKLASDLTLKLGRGFSERNLEQMRRFFLTWSIPQTASAKFLSAPAGTSPIPHTASATSTAAAPLAGLPVFPLPWSHKAVDLLGANLHHRAEVARQGPLLSRLPRLVQYTPVASLASSCFPVIEVEDAAEA